MLNRNCWCALCDHDGHKPHYRSCTLFKWHENWHDFLLWTATWLVIKNWWMSWTQEAHGFSVMIWVHPKHGSMRFESLSTSCILYLGSRIKIMLFHWNNNINNGKNHALSTWGIRRYILYRRTMNICLGIMRSLFACRKVTIESCKHRRVNRTVDQRWTYLAILAWNRE